MGASVVPPGRKHRRRKRFFINVGIRLGAVKVGAEPGERRGVSPT